MVQASSSQNSEHGEKFVILPGRDILNSGYLAMKTYEGLESSWVEKLIRFLVGMEG